MGDSVVKVDEALLKKIESLVKKEKYIYSNKKQVVNIAIIEFLKSKGLVDTGRSSKRGQSEGLIIEKGGNK